MRGLLVALVAVLIYPSSQACGASSLFEITVAAGRHERRNVPVCVPVPAGLAVVEMTSVSVQGPNGKIIPAQLTRAGVIAGDANEVHFIVPHLPAGESVRLKVTISSGSPPNVRGFISRLK